MNIDERISSFARLGRHLDSIDTETLSNLMDKACQANPWFTKENIQLALTGVRKFLHEDVLYQWLSPYSLSDTSSHTVGLVLAGNLPLVGFHDVLSVLITGNRALIKPSSKDTVLLGYVLDELTRIAPRFKDYIVLAEQIKNTDAIIATGGDNTSRYFEYYFGKYPHIIRKNRTSCAILTGDETSDEMTLLGHDIFSYFGLGCRNVAKLYVPSGYSPTRLFEYWDDYKKVMDHHKYYNNYEYQKAVMLVNQIPFLDNGFALLSESDKLVSPISVVYYEFYHSSDDLKRKLAANEEKLQ